MRISHYKTYYLFICTLLIIAQIVISCRPGYKSPHPTLLLAEQLMNERPDSSLLLLEDSIDTSSLSGKDYADWCLLLTQARDKNYIEHSSDSLIRVALDYYEDRDDPDRLMLTCYYMGRVNQDIGDALQAQVHYLKALEMEKSGEASNDVLLKARICSNLGSLYTAQEAFDEALFYLQNGLEHLRQIGNTTSQAVFLRDIGRLYWNLNQSDSAVCYYRQAEQLADQTMRSSVYSELGGLLADRQEYNEALAYLQHSLQVEENPQYNQSTYLSIGKLYTQMEVPDSARYYLIRSIDSPIIKTKASSYYYLSRLAKQSRNWTEYVSLQEKYDALRDTIQKQTYTGTMQRMQSLYNYQLKESENQQLKLQHALARQKYVTGILLIVLLFIGIVLYMLYRKKKWAEHEKRLKQMITLQETETEEQIELNIRQIEKLDEELGNMIDSRKKLLKLKKKSLELSNEQLRLGAELFQEQQELQRLREENFKKSDIFLRMNSSFRGTPDQKERDAYLKAIDEAYPNFMKNILLIYPHMKQDDIALCYYTKIGLGNKEMSHLLCCQPNTVCTKKTRLYTNIARKKGSTDDFNDFISSIQPV